MKKRVEKNLVAISLVLFIVLSSIASYIILNISNEPVFMAPSPITAGVVMFEVLGNLFIDIVSPLNITYNFSPSDTTYPLGLNVTSNFEAENWRYSLYDLKHGGSPVNENVLFSPNTTFNAVRWTNQLFVYADIVGSSQPTVSANVTFIVHVNNTRPALGPINSSIYVCEGDSLNYPFSAFDPDEDRLIFQLTSPSFFFLSFPTIFYGQTNVSSSIRSISLLTKTNVGTYNNIEISVRDNFTIPHSDSKFSDITVIEINNAPNITNIGAQTSVWTRGDNMTFYKEVVVRDMEDGNSTDGNLSFGVTIVNSTGSLVNLFNISSIGAMNFTVNSTDPHLGVYNVEVCVTDSGIPTPYPLVLAECGQDGSPITTCNNFTLTITDENRPPTIRDYYPQNLSLNVSGQQLLYFNITKYDPDGNVPDAYWYVDSGFREYDNGLSSINGSDEFSLLFPCNVGGMHFLMVEITDGLLNDSLNWSMNVARVDCPKPIGGGGGGGGTPTCLSEWGCINWRVCQNAEKSLEGGILSGEDYRLISEQCGWESLSTDACGFQIRDCQDLTNCTYPSVTKPEEKQYCYYSENPDCRDGIRNCHDGACELLIDCGGPCNTCPTCSDSKKNQGEEGTDCGGPCPWDCPPKLPLTSQKWFLYSILLILLIIIVLATIKIIKIYRIKKSVSESSS